MRGKKHLFYVLLGLACLTLAALFIALCLTLFLGYKKSGEEKTAPAYTFTGNEKEKPPAPPPAPAIAAEPLQEQPHPESASQPIEQKAPVVLPQHNLLLTLYGFGANDMLFERALRSLPSSVGLALSPYLKNPEKLLETLKSENRAYFIELPTITHNGLNDAGPLALDTLKPFDEAAQKKTLPFITLLKEASGVILQTQAASPAFIESLRIFCTSFNLPLSIAQKNAPPLNNAPSQTIDEPLMVSKENLETLTSNIYAKTQENHIFFVLMNISPALLEHLLSWVPSIDPAHFNLVSPALLGKIKEEGATHEAENPRS